MNDILRDSSMFGIVITILGYYLGTQLKQKFKIAIINPLLVAIAFVIVFLLIFNIDYQIYNNSAKYLSFLITPATVSLAIPLYQQFNKIKDNFKAIMVGIVSGVVTSFISIYILSQLFKLTHEEFVTFLPKSVTTAIGIVISEELGGITSLTVAVIIITGVLGNIIAEFLCKKLRIINPIAKGVAIGSSSHVIGTVKAMEMGETEGVVSSITMIVTALCTVICISIFASL